MSNRHLTHTKSNWKRQGLILSCKEEFDEIYNRYINSTNCEKCNKKYKSNRDRQMDHSHTIHDKYGYFRNILCQSCNQKRCKIPCTNTSGYKGIYKHKNKIYKQGYCWKFQLTIDGKKTPIKYSIDKEWLIKFAIQWKIDNHYDD